jgi:predicted dithiol-disulfide oxidoreductase (DUF899 family)
MGWTFPWYPSLGSDFNYDFQVSLDEEARPVEHNYRNKQEAEMVGKWVPEKGEYPGLSVFYRGEGENEGEGAGEGKRVYHTYSTYARGLEMMLGTYKLLDVTPLGRQEKENGKMKWRHHDKHDED